MSVNKYFIAIVIPSPIQEEIEKIKQDLLKEHGLKGALRSPAHITLHRPFEWKSEKEEQLISKLRSFRFECGWQIRLHDFGCFPPRVIYIQVGENPNLNSLYNEMKKFAVRELKLLNEAEDMRGFHPHVTAAFRDLKKNRFDDVWQEFKDRKLSGTFEFQGFSLLRLEDTWKEISFFKGE